MKLITKLLVVLVAMGTVCFGNPVKADALVIRSGTTASYVAPTTAITVCPAGQVLGVDGVCRQILAAGTSQQQSAMGELTWNWNGSSWDLVLTLSLNQQLQNAFHETTTFYLIGTYAGTAPITGTDGQVIAAVPPNLPQVGPIGFEGFSIIPDSFTYNPPVPTPLWSREPAQFSVVAPVPEPSTVLLLGAGLAGLAGMAIRRRKKSQSV